MKQTLFFHFLRLPLLPERVHFQLSALDREKDKNSLFTSTEQISCSIEKILLSLSTNLIEDFYFVTQIFFPLFKKSQRKPKTENRKPKTENRKPKTYQ